MGIEVRIAGCLSRCYKPDEASLFLSAEAEGRNQKRDQSVSFAYPSAEAEGLSQKKGGQKEGCELYGQAATVTGIAALTGGIGNGRLIDRDRK